MYPSIADSNQVDGLEAPEPELAAPSREMAHIQPQAAVISPN